MRDRLQCEMTSVTRDFSMLRNAEELIGLWIKLLQCKKKKKIKGFLFTRITAVLVVQNSLSINYPGDYKNISSEQNMSFESN